MHVGTHDAVSELGLAVSNSILSLLWQMYPLLLLLLTSTQALSGPNPSETHSGGLHLRGQAGVLGGNVLSSLL